MTSLTFEIDDFSLISNEVVSQLEIHTCKEDYRTKLAAAELNLMPFSSEEDKKTFVDSIPACFFPIYIYCYLDGNFENREHQIVRYDDKKSLKKSFVMNLSGNYNPDALYGPSDCNINPRVCFQAYITVISECGALCLEDIGVSTIDLKEITNYEKHFLPLKMHTIEKNPTYSRIHLKNIKFIQEPNLDLKPKIQTIQEVQKMVRNYLKNTKKVISTYFMEFMANSDKIACYTNPSQVTFGNSNINMPVASYLLNNPLETDVTFWDNEFRIAVTRYALQHEIDSSDFYQVFSAMSVAEKCSFGMNMIVQYAEMLEYIGDYVVNTSGKGKESIEIFGDALFTKCGDCEDLSSAIIQCFESFLSCNFNESNHANIFTEIVQYFKFYVPFLMIEGVTANNLNNGSKKNSELSKQRVPPKLTGAHGASKFIPYKLLVEYLTRWDSNHSFTQHVKAERLELLKNYTGEEPTEILIGEGTGLLESGVFKDKFFDIRKFVYECPLMEKVKKPIIPPRRDISPFYQALLFGFTHRFIKSCGIGLFHFGTIDPHKYYDNVIPNTLYGRGVTFSDFILQRENVVLCPNILKTQVREYDDDLICVMNSVAKTRIPTPAIRGFSLSSESTISIKDTQTLEKIEAKLSVIEVNSSFVNKFEPPVNHLFSKNEIHLLLQFIDAFKKNREMAQKMRYQGTIYFYILEDYVDPVFIEGLENFFIHHRKPNVPYLVGDVKIYREYHTNDFYVYRCELLVYK